MRTNLNPYEDVAITFTPLYNPMPSASSQDELTMAEALHLPMCSRDSNCSTLHPTLHSQV